MKKYHLLLLSIVSGLLLSASWPANGWTFLAFLAWIPFLFLEDYMYRNPQLFSRGAAVLYSYPGFLAWNVLTTYWVYNSSAAGGIMAFLLNSLFMALCFGLYHLIRKIVFKNNKGFLVLAALWFAYEYGHMQWDLTWSWLVLGNTFASHPQWVQWYEYTGVFGGGLWIMMVNILFFRHISNIIHKEQKGIKNTLIALAALVLVLGPIFWSKYMYNHYTPKGNTAEVVVVQPDIDPYTEEFTTPASELLHNMLSLARQKVDGKTRMVFFPETSIPQTVWERDFAFTYLYDSLRNFQTSYKNRFEVVLGMSTRKLFMPGEPTTSAAREMKNGNFYESYNTATFIGRLGDIRYYHKAKLVPGVEIMPFPSVTKVLEPLIINLGGASGTLGRSNARKIFGQHELRVAPIICYESIYGEFVSAYVRRGANLLTIITNDGWWGNTPGHKQHFQYARLRAIENRRDVARAANTGISGFINQRGDVFEATQYWVPDVRKAEVHLNEDPTFYSAYGDYIARFSILLSALLILIAISLGLRKQKESTSV